jgi:hypothetical protein
MHPCHALWFMKRVCTWLRGATGCVYAPPPPCNYVQGKSVSAASELAVKVYRQEAELAGAPPAATLNTQVRRLGGPR